MAYRITADIRYTTGALADTTLPNGYSVTVPDRAAASRELARLYTVKNLRVSAREDLSDQYVIVGAPKVEVVK